MAQKHEDFLDAHDEHINEMGDDSRVAVKGPQSMDIPQHVLEARANRRPKVGSHGRNTAGKAH
jgi:hypothetical protein